MSTTDLDPQSPLARFLAGSPTGSSAAPAAREGASTRATVTALARAVDRRVDVRPALLAGRTLDDGRLAIRLATDADADPVSELAARDAGARTPAAPHLLAEVDGLLVAAIGVRDRRVVADPTAAGPAVVTRLQAHAAELRGALRRGGRRGWLGRGGR